MYVVTKTGYKLPVDDSLIPEDTYRPFHETVGLYEDCTALKEIWILQLQKNTQNIPKFKAEYEFVQELRYEHEPSKEEILWAMSAYGLSHWDAVNVLKAYELDMV